MSDSGKIKRANRFFRWAVTKWYLVAATLAACFVLFAVYYIYVPRKYSHTISFTLKFDPYGSAMTRDIEMFNELTFINHKTNFDNEKQFFRSVVLAEEIVDRLGLACEVYGEDKMGRTALLYPDSPLIYTFVPAERVTSFDAKAVVEGDTVALSSMHSDDKESGSVIRVPKGKPTETPFGTITFTSVGKQPHDYVHINLHYRLPQQVADELSHNLYFTTASTFATVVNFSYVDYSAERAHDVVAELPHAYNALWHDYILQTTKKSNEFITEQLRVVETLLDNTETRIAEIRSESGRIDKRVDNYKMLHRQMQSEVEQFSAETEIFIIQGILDDMQRSSRLSMLPLNAGIRDRMLNRQITEYNTCLLRLENVKASAPASSEVASLTGSAVAMRSAIETSLRNHARQLAMTEREAAENIALINEEKVSFAKGEWREADRLRTAKYIQEIYMFLKQKQEECLLSMNINLNAVRIIKEASDEPELVSPDVPTALALTLFFGLFFIPYSIYLFGGAFRLRLTKAAEMDDFTVVGSLPVFKAPRGKKQRVRPPLLVGNDITDDVNDAYRLMRTNLDFLFANRRCPVVSVASLDDPLLCATVALNLAQSYAIKGSRVLLIDLDLRYSLLALADRGATSVLNGIDTVAESIDRGEYEGIDLLAAGPQAPNPAELLDNVGERLNIDALRSQYDCIIVNSGQLSNRTDVFLASKIADMTILALRSGMMVSYLETLKQLASSNELPRLSLALCGFDAKKRRV